MISGRVAKAWLAAAAIASGCTAAVFAGDPATRALFVGLAIVSIGFSVILSRAQKLHPAVVIVGAVLLRAAWLPLGPELSDDSYRYIWDGRLTVEGVNPYAHRPDDPSLSEFRSAFPYDSLNSESFYSIYPPVSQVAFAGVVLVSGGKWPAAFYVWKAILGVLDVGVILILLAAAPAPLVLLYAWHPLAAITSAGQGHTEALAVPLLVLGVLLARRSRWPGAAAAIAMAGWVKLVPFLALPFVVFKGRVNALIAGSLVTILLVIPFWMPGVIQNVRSSLDLYVRYFEFNAGLYFAIKQILLEYTGDDWSKQLGPFLRQVFVGGVVIAYCAAILRRWTLERLLLVVYGLFLVLSTTVHPWYLAPVLVLLPLSGRRGMGWQWLAACSLGTYMLYSGGPYWVWVWLGWGGFALITIGSKLPAVLRTILASRGRYKADWILASLGKRRSGAVLDIGAAEGYVAEAMTSRGVAVQAVDLEIPQAPVFDVQRYDGSSLPFPEDHFDVSLLVFVLHHARDPKQVLAEALRVTSGRVVVVESIVESEFDRSLLTVLDRAANTIRDLVARRPLGAEALSHRTPAAWTALINSLGGSIVAEEARYGTLHKQHLFVVAPAGPA